MNTFITKWQLIDFVLNKLNNEERETVSNAIISNSEVKRRYLFEKRKNDIERYIDNEMTIGERCEIEKLIKTDSRLFNYFELNNGVMEDDLTVPINSEHIAITQKQLINFVIYDVEVKEHKEIIEAIITNPVVKERYLHEKRKYDVERYLNNKMDIGERCEIEELITIDTRLFEYFKLRKSLNEKGQNKQENPMHPYITKLQLERFVLNRVSEEERNKIIEAINTNPEIKERYLLEKRKQDVERYVNDEMEIGEQCEIEELIKMNPKLYDHFVLNTEANDAEEQEMPDKPKQITITKEQLAKFILKEINEKEYLEEYKNISEAINSNPLTRERYLFEKRKHDLERYINGEMGFAECCEIEDLLRKSLWLFEQFELIKDIKEGPQRILINGEQITITKEMLENFVLNDVNNEEHDLNHAACRVQNGSHARHQLAPTLHIQIRNQTAKSAHHII